MGGEGTADHRKPPMEYLLVGPGEPVTPIDGVVQRELPRGTSSGPGQSRRTALKSLGNFGQFEVAGAGRCKFEA